MTTDHAITDETFDAAAASSTARPRALEPRDGNRDGAKNMQQLIQLRWIALAGQVATIAVVQFGFRIALPLVAMAVVLACLAAFNLLSLLYWRRRDEASNGALLAGLLVDVVTLTALLYLGGGAANPFVFLYLLQVVLGAVLLRAWSSWVVVGATALGFVGLAMSDSPVAIPADPTRGLADPYVQGLLICFVLNITLLVVFVTRINRILRARDARLAALRQRAAEEEHIVRMGLLASGAAHELGTPLATLSVILGDWRRMPAFAEQPELAQEIDEMQVQLARCKSILTGILLSAGEARGEAPMATTLGAFLDALVADWRGSRPVREFAFECRVPRGIAIVSDTGLRQAIGNVLDNALDASPDWMALQADLVDDDLVLRVRDRGHGFPEAMLARFGTPYQSSKGRAGGGLGLFLALNVARSFGGRLVAHNRRDGGAEVTMTLPLSAIALGDGHDDGR